MRLISFDIGIKNMAFCIFDVSGSQLPTIKQWTVINLMEHSEPAKKEVCNCLNKPKSKKVEGTVCHRLAKFRKGERTFCEKHASSTPDFIIPVKQCSPTQVKKLKVGDLQQMISQHNITNENGVTKRADLVELINAYFKEKCYEPIVDVKGKTAGETDLIQVGKKMKYLLNIIPGIKEVTHVIIENQISPIANRMKTIQGMLAQYFIMILDDPHIDFVSSANKLGSLMKETATVEDAENTYQQHKKDGVELCSQILDKYENFATWKYVLDTKKKDDLADSFLQGIWYLKKKKLF